MKMIYRLLKKKFLTFLYQQKIKQHNRRIFNLKFNNKGKQVILAEFNAFFPEHIGTSYILHCLKSSYKNSKVISHFSHVVLSYKLKRTFMKKIWSNILQIFKLGNFGVYNSMGIKNFFYPTENEKDKIISLKLYKKFLNNIKTLKQLERYKVNNILFGDLLYDCYLKKNYDNVPTIDLKSQKFKEFAYEFITLIVIWLRFFKNHKVVAVIGSHSVYSIGVPLRISINKGIKTFAITPEQICNLSKKMPHEYIEFFDYKNNFNKINKTKKIICLNLAKKKLRKKLSGEFSSDYYYALKSPYLTKKSSRRVITNNKKLKLLVATHDFVDAPHLFGNSLFTDFYQWIYFIGKVSRNTNYEWYIKTHYPYGGKYEIYQAHERRVVQGLVKKFKHFKIIPPKTSMKQLLNEGIDGIFTVNGTIGSEIPYYNIPVVNASLKNPHINYNFNIHPKNINELKKVILNFKNIKSKFKVNKTELYEHYFMRNIYYDKNWMFENHSDMVKKVGYIDQWSYKIYKYWLDNFTMKNHKSFIKRLSKFVRSDEYRMRRSKF
tara:strand:- start:592 stop:2232 length:1641 start_codon:yes stop_codon:yes gene_type:complete